MKRSVWKGPYCDKDLITKLSKQVNKSKAIITWSRRSMVLPEFVGYKFSIHNGCKFVDITVTQDMIGQKFGEFALTRKLAKHKVKKKVVKKK